jgi:hypothetical protein
VDKIHAVFGGAHGISFRILLLAQWMLTPRASKKRQFVTTITPILDAVNHCAFTVMETPEDGKLSQWGLRSWQMHRMTH